MPAPTDLSINDRIALAKGWTYYEYEERDVARSWFDPKGASRSRLDWTGTLEGVSGMLRELHEAGRRCSWSYNIHTHKYICIEDTEFFDDDVIAESPEDHPGDCVGDAWLSVKEAADGS